MDRKISTWNVYSYLKIVVVFILISILSSCSHVTVKDGPPNYYIDVSKIPNAKPVPLKKSKYGNPRSYCIAGRRYHPLTSSRNFIEKGIASWYGTRFHGHSTSDGERYNMLEMTAAHKTLPLPTFVEVTNLKNHRKIIVKVTDRGPFKPNRIIDLSYVAAKKLDMLGNGTAPVRIVAIDPLTYGKAIRIAKHTSSRRHPLHFASRRQHITYMRVGTFKNKSNAFQLKRRLTAMLEMPVKVTRSRKRDRLYHVQVGPIRDVATRAKVTNRLEDLGVNVN